MGEWTDSGSGDFAGKGTTGVAWAGLGLGVLNLLAGGGWGGPGGLLGGRPGMGGMGAGNLVTDAAVSELAKRDAEIAQLKAEAFTNATVQSFYDRHAQETADAIAQQAKVTDATIAPIAADVKTLREQNVEHNAQLACMEKTFELQKEINDLKTEKAIAAAVAPLTLANQRLADSLVQLQQQVASGLATERQERQCADNALANYCNATFYPKAVADVTTGSTTTPQTTYNPLPCAGCGCGSRG